ncbi:MAG: DUF3426 domain-containing protein [Desulfobacteraceae bacterium]|nr:MAG: DUF3426 domain-containing protein [Desulfobacteraceae bacterium]
MIVECEKCKSQFNVDEGVLKEDGSKVRCSVCKNIFLVYPKRDRGAESTPDLTIDDDMEETVALDSPPRLEDRKNVGRDQHRIPVVALDRLTLEDDLTDEPDMFMEKESESPPPLVSPKQLKSGRSSALPVFLIVIFLLFGAAAVGYFFFPGLIPGLGSPAQPVVVKPEIPDAGIHKLRIQAQAIESYFVKSDKAGELFIIKGSINNNYPTARGKILLQVSIFDGQNKVILKKNAYAGNVFSDEELKSLTVEQIDAAMNNSAGKDNKNLKVEPGTAIPFMVIFNNLPENAKDFSPDLLRSSAGS